MTNNNIFFLLDNIMVDPTRVFNFISKKKEKLFFGELGPWSNPPPKYKATL